MKPTSKQPIVATSSRIAYENKWLRIREDQTLRAGGVRGIYGVVETEDSVVVCAVNEAREVYLIYGYSYPTDTWSWQIPGGGGEGEAPTIAAARELGEETGLQAGHYEVLGNLIVSCGLLKERMAVVLATELQMGARTEADDSDSVTEGKFVSLTELRQMIRDGEVCDGQSIAAIYLLEDWMERHGN